MRISRSRPTRRRRCSACPEVQLGLIPGGVARSDLPRLVGLEAALDMILTGRNIRARKALQMGLIHELVHPAILDEIAIERAKALADGRLEARHVRVAHTERDTCCSTRIVLAARSSSARHASGFSRARAAIIRHRSRRSTWSRQGTRTAPSADTARRLDSSASSP